MLIERDHENQLRRIHLGEEFLSDHCFLRYASQEWEEHAVAAGRALTTGYEFRKDILDRLPEFRDTWLHRVAAVGQEVVVRRLLENGAEVESKEDYGQTPLSLAAEHGHAAVVELLLQKGAEVESKNNCGQIPLLFTTEHGHAVVVELLLQKGAKVESKDNYR